MCKHSTSSHKLFRLEIRQKTLSDKGPSGLSTYFLQQFGTIENSNPKRDMGYLLNNEFTCIMNRSAFGNTNGKR